MSIKKQYKDLITGESPKLVVWIFPIIGLLILILVPFLLTRPGPSLLNYKETGGIGDTIGGIAGPIIALFAAFLTFLAFWIQLRANKLYINQFDKQDNDTKIDRFENKYYELLRIHRENVTEFKISGEKGEITGKKIFISLYIELKFCYLLVEKIYNIQKGHNQCSQNLLEKDLLNIAYLTFYIGVGDNSDILLKDILNNYDNALIDKYIENIKAFQEKWHSEITLSANGGTKTIFKHQFKYRPFEGHMSRLSHYYRHLFQMASFVLDQKDDIIKGKYEYLKTLRAQLSSHEQLLLYYNSFTVLGESWYRKGLLTTYLMIKNMPLSLADFGPLPNKFLPEKNKNEKYLFEWYSLRDKLKPSS